ncbi:hypothetical protein Ddye_026291 [Dipteronia dyeriana]|uniref:Phosphoesterase n=1 Tax=Dipteronia dyeriana TaxID=168575 RepID=A0AAD9TMG1_9ROSI|nr:hypothetical protein Ddye_026291 [Dipteronia dyeriana]
MKSWFRPKVIYPMKNQFRPKGYLPSEKLVSTKHQVSMPTFTHLDYFLGLVQGGFHAGLANSHKGITTFVACPQEFDTRGNQTCDLAPNHTSHEVLRASPQWNQILFIITYDEHGGFYDHVPTPVTGVPSTDDLVVRPPYYFNFDRLGVRVPAMFISPWIDRGTVLHGPSWPYPTSEFEHSSIPATVKKIFLTSVMHGPALLIVFSIERALEQIALPTT